MDFFVWLRFAYYLLRALAIVQHFPRIRSAVGLDRQQSLPKVIPCDLRGRSDLIQDHGQDPEKLDFPVAGKIGGRFFGVIPERQLPKQLADRMDEIQRSIGHVCHLHCHHTGLEEIDPAFFRRWGCAGWV